MKGIEDKAKDTTSEKDDSPPWKEDIKEKKDEVIDEEKKFLTTGCSTMEKEHPKLAQYYCELNMAIWNLHTIGPRSRDLKRKYENEAEEIRTHIKNYKKNEGITRDMEIRWLKG